MRLKRASVANAQGDTFTSRQYKVTPENGKKIGSPLSILSTSSTMLASGQKSWLGPMITFASELLEIPFRWFRTKIKFCSEPSVLATL